MNTYSRWLIPAHEDTPEVAALVAGGDSPPPLAALTRTRWLRPLWYFYPVLVSVVVVVTANHFWVDAALGGIVAALSYYGASYALARARPQAWAWRGGAAEAEVAA